MSYLDVPRIHFSGTFVSDPSTANNTLANYAAAPAAVVPQWNPNGKHWFEFKNCRVRSVINTSGNAMAGDPLVGGAVETTNTPQFARLVDLDPDFQTGSQIWALELRVRNAAGVGSVSGKMLTATLRDLWMSRAPGGFAAGFAGVYQSVLTDLQWTNLPASGGLRLLNSASPTALSIKFVLYAYNATTGSPGFTEGKIVGSLGPAGATEPQHVLAERRMEDAGAGAFGAAPFKVDAARRRLILDLGNSIPESVAGGARVALGQLDAVILNPSPAAPTVVGSVTYDQAHFELTAGIEELPLTSTQVTSLRTKPLGLRANSGTPGARLILSERPDGSLLLPDQTVFRLEPLPSGLAGPPSSTPVDFIATEFGRPKNGQTISLSLVRGTPATGLVFSSSATTGADGRARLNLIPGNPGHPRAGIDGQVYHVAYHWGAVAPAARRGVLVARVFDQHTSVASPTWANVQPIFAEFAKLYPLMKAILDLSDPAVVRANSARIQASMAHPDTDPRYMPVTRDLSFAKRQMILDWFSNGTP